MMTELSLDALVERGWDVCDYMSMNARDGLVRDEDEDEIAQ